MRGNGNHPGAKYRIPDGSAYCAGDCRRQKHSPGRRPQAVGEAVFPAPVTLMDTEIFPILLRYIDEYQWSFNIAKRLINMYYGTAYTEKELKRLYKNSRTAGFSAAQPGRSSKMQ